MTSVIYFRLNYGQTIPFSLEFVSLMYFTFKEHVKFTFTRKEHYGYPNS